MATKKKILLVIDVQNDFITGALRNEEAIKTLPNIVNLVKNNDWYEIYATMDTHNKDTYLTKTLEGSKLPIEHCIKGTWGWEMPSELGKALDAGKIALYVTHCENTICDGEVLKNNGLIDIVYTTNSIFGGKESHKIKIIREF